MWTIIFRELKDRKWSLLAYSLGSLALLWVYVATFRSSQQNTQQLLELVKSYPKGMLAALGLNDIAVNTIEQYLNLEYYSSLWPLLAIILALSRAGSQLAGDIQTGTMGLLLALPLERWRIFAAKYLAGVATIIIFTVVSVFGIIPLSASANIPTHLHSLLAVWVVASLFMGTVYAVGLAVSSVVSESSKVYAITGFLMVATYTANIIAALVGSLDKLKYLSPFFYLNTHDALFYGTVHASSLYFFGAVIVVASALAAWRFTNRDVYV